MSESKSDSDDDSSSSSSDSSIPSEQEVRSEEEDDNNKTRAKSAAEEDDDVASSSSSSEEEEQQKQEGHMFNGKLYPSYQEMVAAKQERNRRVLERTTSEISLMLGSEYGSSSSSSSSSSSKKKKPQSKKLNISSGPPRRNPKRKARSPSSSSVSTSSHLEDIPRKRSRSIGSSSSRNSINSTDGGSISSYAGKVPSDVFMNNESIATQSTFDKNDMLLQPYNRLVKDMCIQTEQILVNGKRIQRREKMWQEFRRRSSGDGISSSNRSQKKGREEEDDDMSTHEDITCTVDWKLFHSSTTVAGSLTQGNGGNIGKEIRQDRDTVVDKVLPKFSSFIDDDEDDIVIPQEYLAEETDTHTTQQQLSGTLPINNPAKYNNIVQERNTYYTSKGIDRYWDEQYGDGIDPDLFVKERCKGSCTDNPTADGLDNNDSTGNTTNTQHGDLVEAERYTDSLLQRCWDRAVHAASSTLSVPLSNEMEEGGVEGAVKTEETDDSSPPNQTVIDSALCQKARDAVDGILGTLLAKDSSLRLKLEDLKLKHQIDWRDVLDCLRTATQKQEKTREEGVLDPNLLKLSIRLIERYGIANNG